MPEPVGSTTSTSTAPSGSTSAAVATPSSPATSTFRPPSDSGWQDGSKFANASDDGDTVASHDDDGISEVLADSPDAENLLATGVVDAKNPLEPNADADTAAEATAQADDFNPTALREARDAENAVLALLDAGISEERVKSLWKADKAALVEWAKSLAPKQDASNTNQPAAAESDPFDPIFKEAEKSLSEVYGDESAEAKAIVGTLRPIVDQIKKAIGEQITGVRGQYDSMAQAHTTNLMRVESEFAASQLSAEFPKLNDEAGFNAVVTQMVKNVKDNGKKYPNVRAAMKEAANDLWGKEKELARRQAMAQEAKVQSQGQPSLKTGKGPVTAGPKAITSDEWENGVYAAVTNAKKNGTDPQAAADDFKRRFVVKR